MSNFAPLGYMGNGKCLGNILGYSSSGEMGTGGECCLNTLQWTEQPLQGSIIWPKMLVVPRLRNPVSEFSFLCIDNNSYLNLDDIIQATWPSLRHQGSFSLKGDIMTVYFVTCMYSWSFLTNLRLIHQINDALHSFYITSARFLWLPEHLG